ncbi:hypothetical protein HN415_05985 [Candidatus Woesearchaeota archaeon]|nr:hypothetical protein [Candidatus Woesearchaeota archaeon]
MAEIKRSYNIPLRREFLKVPKYRRANKSISAIKKFLIKHMKCPNISIGEKLNSKIWQHGIKNPPHHVLVDVLKTVDDKVYCELQGFEIKVYKKKEPEKAKTLKDKIEEKFEGKSKNKVIVKKSKDAEETKTKKVVKKIVKAEEEKLSDEVKEPVLEKKSELESKPEDINSNKEDKKAE